MVREFAILLFLISMTACKGAKIEEHSINVTSIVNTGNDGASGDFCAAFSLTKDEAQHFFNNAKQVSAKEIHDSYSYLPCFVTGEAYLNNKKCEWEIRAGGTSSIVCEDLSFTMACKDCLPMPE